MSLLAARWKFLATRLAPEMVRRAPKPLSPPGLGGGSGLGGGLAVGGSPARGDGLPVGGGSGLGGGLAVGGGLPSRVRPIPLSGPTFVPNLWVEKGVIWNTATNLVLGFTSYAAQTNFMSLCETSFPGIGLKSAPKSWYAGAFSITDMPILIQQLTSSPILGSNFLLLWPSLASLSFAASFLATLPITISGKPGAGSSALPVSTATSFQALSPEGQKTFAAKYVLFAPYGSTPDPGMTVSASSSVGYDLLEYGWWWNP
jgi:hypothetical protein